MAISLFHLIDMVERRWCPATLVEDKGEDEKGGADGAGEQDGSDPNNLLTITVQAQP